MELQHNFNYLEIVTNIEGKNMLYTVEYAPTTIEYDCDDDGGYVTDITLDDDICLFNEETELELHLKPADSLYLHFKDIIERKKFDDTLLERVEEELSGDRFDETINDIRRHEGEF